MAFISGYCRLHNLKILSTQIQDVHAADFSDFQMKLYDALKPDYPKFYKMDAQCKMGFLGAEILLKEIPVNNYLPEEIAVVLSNADASLDADIQYQASLKVAASPSLFVYTLANIVAGEVCIRNNFQGENAFFISNVFDADLLETYVEQVLMNEGTKACLAGWVNVLDDQHDVLLYLVEKQKRGMALPHTALQLNKLYLN
jgi:hypothetical protein